MFLYHYGQSGYTSLKTLETQRKITKKEQQEAIELHALRRQVAPGYYYQHLSFLFEPVHSDHWKYFNTRHPVWRRGASLTQYTVDTSQIGDFKWMIVETPEITDAKYDETMTEKDFWDLYVKINQTKYIGEGSASLDKAAKEFIGHQDKYLKLAHRLDPHSTRYAADVPHVMLYPKEGMVLFESNRTVQLK